MAANEALLQRVRTALAGVPKIKLRDKNVSRDHLYVDGKMCVSVSGDELIAASIRNSMMSPEKSVVGAWQSGRRVSQMGCYNACPRRTYDEPDGSNPAIAEGKTARAWRNGATGRGVGGPGEVLEVRKERLSVLSPPRCGGLCQRPLARKSRRRSVSAGRNGRKTSEPSEGHRGSVRLFSTLYAD